MSTYQENMEQLPIASAPPAYLYAQYSDDADLQAFVQAFNDLVDGYLNWFTDTPLANYCNLSGPLLDWIGANLYGIPRPTVGTESVRTTGYMGSNAMGLSALGILSVKQSGTALQLTDDLYKRLLTFWLFLGDGKQMSLAWIRRRFARFLFGVNGGDIPVEYLQQVSITIPNLPPMGAMGSQAIGYGAMGVLNTDTPLAKHNYTISIPQSVAASALQQLFLSNLLPMPFQISFQIVVQG
jgi:hypothetical protein